MELLVQARSLVGTINSNGAGFTKEILQTEVIFMAQDSLFDTINGKLIYNFYKHCNKTIFSIMSRNYSLIKVSKVLDFSSNNNW
jgi:hypothetical protein